MKQPFFCYGLNNLYGLELFASCPASTFLKFTRLNSKYEYPWRLLAQTQDNFPWNLFFRIRVPPASSFELKRSQTSSTYSLNSSSILIFMIIHGEGVSACLPTQTLSNSTLHHIRQIVLTDIHIWGLYMTNRTLNQSQFIHIHIVLFCSLSAQQTSFFVSFVLSSLHSAYCVLFNEEVITL